MTAGVSNERATEVVRRWAYETLGWGPDKVGVHPAPQLSTPHWLLVVLAQAGVHHGGELYVMTDGERVLPASAENLARVLLDEGLAENPDALPRACYSSKFVHPLLLNIPPLYGGIGQPEGRSAYRQCRLLPLNS